MIVGDLGYWVTSGSRWASFLLAEPLGSFRATVRTARPNEGSFHGSDYGNRLKPRGLVINGIRTHFVWGQVQTEVFCGVGECYPNS